MNLSKSKLGTQSTSFLAALCGAATLFACATSEPDADDDDSASDEGSSQDDNERTLVDAMVSVRDASTLPSDELDSGAYGADASSSSLQDAGFTPYDGSARDYSDAASALLDSGTRESDSGEAPEDTVVAIDSGEGVLTDDLMTDAGRDLSSCDGAGEACCEGTCGNGLECLGGVTCSCVEALFNDYVLRTDGQVLWEGATETVILDASTGLPLAGVTSIAVGDAHGCAARDDGSVVCWRTANDGNASGQLANGDLESGALLRATPVLTAANTPLTNAVAMANGSGEASCAIVEGGGVYCWGRVGWIANGGVGLDSPYAVPVTTNGIAPLQDVIQLSLSIYDLSACAIIQGESDREVWCWGVNAQRNLGFGDTMDRPYPTSKVLGLSDPSLVTMTHYEYNNGHQIAVCAIDGGNLRCWGSNVYGEVGIGTTGGTVNSPTLVTLEDDETALDQIVDLDSAGINFCALRNDGGLWCWGQAHGDKPVKQGITNAVAAGWRPGAAIRVLTSDGVLHIDDNTRSIDCGRLD